jgi:UDP-N-acetylmuramoyl-L-alanyl-D-glutamate--2,6-diaminopimelate ligase
MRLSALFPGLAALPAFADRDISGLAQDSRAVKPGHVFFAVPGTKADGFAFVQQAVAAGAVAVVAASQPAGLPEHVTFVHAADVRQALTEASRRPSPRSPAPAARHRSPPSCASFGCNAAIRRLRLEPLASSPRAARSMAR